MVVAIGLTALFFGLRRWAAAVLVILVALDATAMYISAPTVITACCNARHATRAVPARSHRNEQILHLGTDSSQLRVSFDTPSADVIDIPVPKKWGHYLVTSLDPASTYFNFTEAGSGKRPVLPRWNRNCRST